MDRKIASKATYLLSQLLEQHPAMAQIVVSEVERLLFRPNIADRARYYAITFLNQIVLTNSKKDLETANTLMKIYFTIFSGLVKIMKNGPKTTEVVKKDRSKPKSAQKKRTPVEEIESDSLNSKMMAALLTGVNRAFPFAKLDDEVYVFPFFTHFYLVLTLILIHCSRFATCLVLILVFKHSTSSFRSRRPGNYYQIDFTEYCTKFCLIEDCMKLPSRQCFSTCCTEH